MALIAKEILRVGHTVVALPGTRVAEELVKEHGWDKLVEEERPKKAAKAAEQK